jgi:hypothetical protein
VEAVLIILLEILLQIENLEITCFLVKERHWVANQTERVTIECRESFFIDRNVSLGAVAIPVLCGITNYFVVRAG